MKHKTSYIAQYTSIKMFQLDNNNTFITFEKIHLTKN